MILGDYQRFFRVPNFWWSTDIWILLGCIKIGALWSFLVVTFEKTAKFLGFCLVF
jgi:hypothetical protein